MENEFYSSNITDKISHMTLEVGRNRRKRRSNTLTNVEDSYFGSLPETKNEFKRYKPIRKLKIHKYTDLSQLSKSFEEVDSNNVEHPTLFDPGKSIAENDKPIPLVCTEEANVESLFGLIEY